YCTHPPPHPPPYASRLVRSSAPLAMLRSNLHLPLTRRLTDYYFLFGLAGLFSCVVLALLLASQGTLASWAAAWVVLPIIFLLAGSLALRHAAGIHEKIENQLVSIMRAPVQWESRLRELPADAPAAQGWNLLIREFQERGHWSSLEERLGQILASPASQRWEGVFAAIAEGLAICDAEDVILQANPTWLGLFGQTDPAAIVGRTLQSLLADHPGGMPAWDFLDQSRRRGAWEVIPGDTPAAGVWRVACLPLLKANQPTGEYLWSIRDITQQKLAENARTQFVTTATHELRTPLANIKAYAETLAAAPDIDLARQQGFYNIINAEATRLARFIDDLLNVSQMEAGAIGIERHEVDLDRLVREVTEHVQPQLQQKRQRFDCRLPGKLPKLRADKDKLAAALINLLGNAVKYTPEDGDVRLQLEEENHQLHFHVEDTGIGIEEAEIPQLCQKFFRSRDARVRQLNGSGLGLAFAREVAQLHGGKLSIRSELNKGSRFSLTVPLH
ncbi:MAG: ATP-binding protein, partial [Pirellulales bacterium]|nr:ATP-binding protein [Pirellulales bacterium]